MIKKCNGCGVLLQTDDEKLVGFSRDASLDLCERCFRIKHYGDYQVVEKDNEEYLNILKSISDTNDLVLFVVDLFNINKEVYELASMIKNPCLLVLTKRDLLAKDIYNKKLIEYVSDLPINIEDCVMISSKNNLGFDELYNKLNKLKRSTKVYIVGLTNAGKSTMVNRLIKDYSNADKEVTTSMLPSTTLGMVEIKMNDDLILVDTPGILDHSIANVVSPKTLKKIVPKKTIRPITYQIKIPQSILVEDILRLDFTEKNNITLFFSNQLKIERFYKEHSRLKHLVKHNLDVPCNSDVVISGLGFIKVMKQCHLDLYTLDNVEVSIRKAFI